MMQAAETGKGDDLASARRFHRARFGRVLGQRQMCPTMSVVSEVLGQDAAEVIAEQQRNRAAYVPQSGSGKPASDDTRSRIEAAVKAGDVDAVLDAKFPVE